MIKATKRCRRHGKVITLNMSETVYLGIDLKHAHFHMCDIAAMTTTIPGEGLTMAMVMSGCYVLALQKLLMNTFNKWSGIAKL